MRLYKRTIFLWVPQKSIGFASEMEFKHIMYVYEKILRLNIWKRP